MDLAVLDRAGKTFNADGALQANGAYPIFVPLLPATLRAPDLVRDIHKRLSASTTPPDRIGLRLRGLSLTDPRQRA